MIGVSFRPDCLPQDRPIETPSLRFVHQLHESRQPSLRHLTIQRREIGVIGVRIGSLQVNESSLTSAMV